MKIFSSSPLAFLAALFMLVFFAACEKDEIKVEELQPITPPVTTTTTSPVVGRLASSGTQAQSSSSTGALEIECIRISYPFDFIVDGVSYTMTNLSDVANLFENIVGPNTMSVDFDYPLNVTLLDGSIVSAVDENELSHLVSSCVPGSGWGTGFFPAFFFDDPDCIRLDYPVTLADADGNIETLVDQTSFVDFIAANPNYHFEFPLSVIDPDGATFDVPLMEDLFDILAECAIDTSGGASTEELFFILGGDCFTYDFPVNIVNAAGDVQSVSDENELSATILNGDFYNFEYSFTVTLDASNTQVTIADEDDFIDILESCFGVFNEVIYSVDFISQSIYDSCYTMVYPFEIDDMGTIITINNATEAFDFLDAGEGVIVFPIDVISNGQQLTLSEPSEYIDLAEDCTSPGLSALPAQFFLQIGLDSASCYELIYPVTITNQNRTTLTLSTEAEVNTYLQGNPDGFVEFPVDVIETSTGNILTLLGSNDYVALLENC